MDRDRNQITDPVVLNALELLNLNGFEDVTVEANEHKNSQPATIIGASGKYRQPDYYKVFAGPDQYGGGVHYCEFDYDVVDLAQQYELVKPLSALKPGDEVALRAGASDDYEIFKIREVSARGIITIASGRYRPDGSPMNKGDKWYRFHKIEPVTETISRSIRQRRLASRLNAIDINQWNKMELDTLEAIAAILDKRPGKEEKP